MRFIKSYKLFEDESNFFPEEFTEIKSTIDDILLELEDEGFECECNLSWGMGKAVDLSIYKADIVPNGHGGLVSMPNHNLNEYEYWNIIEDTMNRIYSYLSTTQNKLNLYYIFEEPNGIEKYINISLEKDTLKNKFSEYYNKSDGGFTIYFKMERDVWTFHHELDDTI